MLDLRGCAGLRWSNAHWGMFLNGMQTLRHLDLRYSGEWGAVKAKGLEGMEHQGNLRENCEHGCADVWACSWESVEGS